MNDGETLDNTYLNQSLRKGGLRLESVCRPDAYHHILTSLCEKEDCDSSTEHAANPPDIHLNQSLRKGGLRLCTT